MNRIVRTSRNLSELTNDDRDHADLLIDRVETADCES